MAHPLDGEVTRPDRFDPRRNEVKVIVRGGEWLGDFDLNDLQAIHRHDLKVILASLFRDGAILVEAGGTIATPVPGVVLGGDSLGSAGTYTGVESQNYIVTILTGGAAGVATYTWRATGADNPNVVNTAVPVTAIAPDLSTALADLETYGHPVGLSGVLVVFVNPTDNLTAGNSWVVAATYGSRPPVVDGDDITVADLLVYGGDGRVYRVLGNTLTYPSASSGTDIVYAEATRVIVDHVDDPTLTDPESDRGQAWREVWTMLLRNEDTSGDAPGPGEVERRVFALYRWDRATDVVTKVIPKPYAIDIARTEGALDAERLLNVDQNVLLRGILARLDEGAHGTGYVIEPRPPAARGVKSTNAASSGKIRLRFPSIRASVAGVPVLRADPTELEVDQAIDTLHVSDEPHLFATGTNLYRLNKNLNAPFFPVKEITKVTATVQKGIEGSVGYEQVTRGGGSTDALALTPVISIQRISNTDGGAANYTQGTHYSLVGNAVNWITGAPSGGASYYVVYRYQKTMTPTSDYLLTDGQVDFSPSGDDPVNTTSFEVDYDHYVPRTDTVILRPNAALEVLKGLPAEEPITPAVPLNTLAYCRVEIPPNSLAPVLKRFPNDAVSMEKLNHVLDALDEVVRNQALGELRDQARARQAGLSGTPNTAGLIDIVVEGFGDDAIADETYSAGGHAYSALIDEERGELTVPATSAVATPAKTSVPAGEQDVTLATAFYMIPYTHELALDAPLWSKSYPVNPYADFTPEPPLAALEPSRDAWVDTSAVTTTATRRIMHGKAKVIARVFTEVATRASETAAVFMRQIQVKIRGYHFVPGERCRVKFDGKDVAFTAVSPSTQGADSFTVIARASDATHRYGTLDGTINVPANVPTGTVAVEIYGEQGTAGSWPGAYSVRARATFSSEGMQREVATEITTVIVRNDPIAQSFLFPAARMVSRVDVPLMAKPAELPGSPPLVVELRATDRSGAASTPIDEVLGRVTVDPVQLSTGPVVSNLFTFPDPVHMAPQEYRALVLRSASNEYRAFVAQLGERQHGGGFIESQQIEGGIFMDSSNNADWTPHQGWDLRTKIYVAKFNPLEARLYLARVSVANMTGFYMAPDQVVPDGTSIEWQYSTDGISLGGGGKVWKTFVPFQVVEFTAASGTLDVRAILRTSSAYVSPAIHAKNISLVTQVNATSAKYVSVRKELSANSTTIHGSIELATPPSGDQDVFLSTNDGGTWVAATLTAGQPVGDGFVAHAFTATGLTSDKRLRIRVDQSTPNRAQRPRARALVAYAPPV